MLAMDQIEAELAFAEKVGGRKVRWDVWHTLFTTLSGKQELVPPSFWKGEGDTQPCASSAGVM